MTSRDTSSVRPDSDQPKRPRIDWADPKVPVGNAPPMSRWLLYVTGASWLAWIVFLIAMAASRYQGGSM